MEDVEFLFKIILLPTMNNYVIGIGTIVIVGILAIVRLVWDVEWNV